MRFKKIMWKNLLSYGNKMQSYEFKNGPNLVHIEGENGAGKSAIKEALTISAYGKSALRKMKDLPNWINRAAYTYNEFVTNSGDTVIVERGIDPNFSEISINGVPHNLPDKRKIDDFIENELLHYGFPLFCNTISLSFDDFKSFVNLSASDKRKIVDPMFGIDVLTDMRSNIKEDIKENKLQLNIFESNISKNERLLESSIDQLKQLRIKIEEAASIKSTDLKAKIGSKTETMNVHKSKYSEFKAKIDSIRERAGVFRERVAASNSKIFEYSTKLNIFKNNKCPHCMSDLTGDDTLEIKNAILAKKEAESELIISITKKQAQVKEIVNNLVKDQDFEKEKFYKYQSDIASLERELSKAQEDTQDNQEDSIHNIIETIKADMSKSESDSKKYRDNLELYDLLDEVLSDTGIKRSLIDKVIPLLNTRIRDISDRFEFKFNFEFDNEFNPIITYMGMQISPEALSTGQRKKMNLIVLLSFIELIKMKHPDMNVIFLDEIFSGLDKKNVNMAMEILREYADKYSMTIFVVSHETLPEEFFDEKIKVTMPNHFSEMEVTSNIRSQEEPG